MNVRLVEDRGRCGLDAELALKRPRQRGIVRILLRIEHRSRSGGQVGRRAAEQGDRAAKIMDARALPPSDLAPVLSMHPVTTDEGKPRAGPIGDNARPRIEPSVQHSGQIGERAHRP